MLGGLGFVGIAAIVDDELGDGVEGAGGAGAEVYGGGDHARRWLVGVCEWKDRAGEVMSSEVMNCRWTSNAPQAPTPA